MGLFESFLKKKAADPEKTAVPAWSFDTGEELFCIAISTGGEFVVTGSNQRRIFCLSREGTLQWSSPAKNTVTGIAISRDGQYIVAGSLDKKITLFRGNGDIISGIETGSGVSGIAMSSDGQYIIVSVVPFFPLVSIPSPLLGFSGICCFSRDGRLLWKHKNLNLHSFAVSGDSGTIAAASDDHVITCLDRSGKVLWTRDIGHTAYSVAIPADGQFVFAGGSHDTLYCFSRDGKILWERKAASVANPRVIVSRDGNIIAVTDFHGIDDKVCCFDKDGKPLWICRVTGNVRSAAVSPDGRFIIAGTDVGIISCFRADGTLYWQFEAPGLTCGRVNGLALSSDGQHLAAIIGWGRVYFFYLHHFQDTFQSLQKKIRDRLAELNSRLAPLQAEGFRLSDDAEIIASRIDAGNYIAALQEINRTLSELPAREASFREASALRSGITSPDLASLYDAGKYDEFLEKYQAILNRKKEGQALLEKSEAFGSVPETLRTRASSSDPEIIESAIRDLEAFLRDARPDLAITIDRTEFTLNAWHRVRVDLANRGDAHAVNVTLSVPEELETRRNTFSLIRAGMTESFDLGLKPKAKGTIPVEITATCQDGTGKEYRQIVQIWIEVTGEEISAGRPEPGSPVSAAPGTGSGDLLRLQESRQIPAELSDRYSESGFLGKGGFARVFRARKGDGTEIAVKIPVSFDLATGKSFMAEIRNWTRLSHPNIVKVHDYNILPVPYVEMELCDSSLADMEKPVTPETAAWIFFNICEGLKFAHSQKIIHRDLKPGNILLKSGVPKISDWGLSRVVDQSTSGSTASFSPCYAAPEQISGRTKDERTDIWQLGVILFELVTGALPFTGESMVEIGMKIATKEPEFPAGSGAQVKNLEPVIRKCLAKDPAQRFQSVADVQKSLAGFLQSGYLESLKVTAATRDFNRSAQYCGDLLMISLCTGNLPSAYVYASDLVHYCEGDARDLVEELAGQIRTRIEQGISEVPDEILRKAEILVHAVRRGMRELK
jgi:outer membrane protein assembly factor BamB